MLRRQILEAITEAVSGLWLTNIFKANQLFPSSDTEETDNSSDTADVVRIDVVIED